MNLFDYYGVEPVKEEPKKKAAPKQKAKKASAKGRGAGYALPITVYLGACQAFTMKKQEKEKIMREELLDAIAEKYPFMQKEFLSLEAGKNTAYACWKKSLFTAKGAVPADTSSHLLLPDGREIPVPTDSLEDGKLPIGELPAYLAETAGWEYGQELLAHADKKGKAILVQPACRPLSDAAAKKLSFPVILITPDGKHALLKEEGYRDFLREQGNAVTGKAEITAKMLSCYVEDKLLPELSGHLALTQCTDKALDQIMADEKIGSIVAISIKVSDSGSALPEKTLFPTEGTRLVVGVDRETILSAAFFDGKEEVEEADIIAYAHENISPIFKEGRCHADYYEEERMIFLAMKGSTKGAYEVVGCRKRYDELIRQPYASFYHDCRGQMLAVEKTPSGIFSAQEEGGAGTFQAVLPKIPLRMHDCIRAFFRDVAKTYRTEVLVRIYWDIAKKQHYAELPRQKATGSSITELSDDRFGLQDTSRYPVAEFHSHCFHSAFFSPTDDMDEVMPLIYGVWGSFQDAIPTFCMRGCAMTIPFAIEDISDVFSGRNATAEEERSFSEAMMLSAQKMLTAQAIS